MFPKMVVPSAKYTKIIKIVHGPFIVRVDLPSLNMMFFRFCKDLALCFVAKSSSFAASPLRISRLRFANEEVLKDWAAGAVRDGGWMKKSC